MELINQLNPSDQAVEILEKYVTSFLKIGLNKATSVFKYNTEKPAPEEQPIPTTPEDEPRPAPQLPDLD